MNTLAGKHHTAIDGILSQRARYKKEVLKEKNVVLTKENSSQESIAKHGSK